MARTLFRGGEVVHEDGIRREDILVEGERILALGPELPGENEEEIVECAGRLLFPGIVDPHVHLRIPIKRITSADNFESGSQAALHGGVTTLIDFTVPGGRQGLLESVEHRLRQAEMASCDVALHCNVTRLTRGILNEIGEVARMGIPGFKVFTAYEEAGMRLGYDQIEQVAERVADCGGILMAHAEDTEILRAAKKDVPADSANPALHASLRPDSAEAVAVERLGKIADDLQTPIYIVHLSSARGLTAAQHHSNLTLETCPQYLLLDSSAYERPDGRMFIASPPLRRRTDCEELWSAARDGRITAIGTDHCLFRLEDKPGGEPVGDIPNGIGGVETAFPLLFLEFQRRSIPLTKLTELMSAAPARVFGLYPRKGSIAPGSDADLVIMDPGRIVKVRERDLLSAADWNAYEGMDAVLPQHVFRRGEWMVREGRLISQSRGCFIPGHLR